MMLAWWKIAMDFTEIGSARDEIDYRLRSLYGAESQASAAFLLYEVQRAATKLANKCKRLRNSIEYLDKDQTS